MRMLLSLSNTARKKQYMNVRSSFMMMLGLRNPGEIGLLCSVGYLL